MVKKITLLGATGTIGKNTISLIEGNPEKFQIETLIANNNVKDLAKIAKNTNAKNAVIANEEKFIELKSLLQGTNIKAFAGEEAVESLSSQKVDIFISGAVGFSALKPTLAAIRAGNKIGLANKECLVCAGDLMMKLAKENSAQIIPIDSEHNSIYQVFDFDKPHEIEKVILTASGGPFLQIDNKMLANVTPEMAVKHPNWEMGKKISVDSATMMNKGLEVIEAYYLFPVEKNQIDVLIHPQSIIHGLVTYVDGSMLAGISGPDMRIPISYAISHPKRLKNSHGKIDLADITNLTFKKPDFDKFRCLQIALDALRQGQVSQITLNAANEVAVDAFLNKKIPFTNIAQVVEDAINKIAAISKNKVDDLEEIFDIDENARKITQDLIQGDKIKISTY